MIKILYFVLCYFNKIFQILLLGDPKMMNKLYI